LAGAKWIVKIWALMKPIFMKLLPVLKGFKTIEKIAEKVKQKCMYKDLRIHQAKWLQLQKR
jgi:hypothetical protein